MISPKKGSTGKGGAGLKGCFGQGCSEESESELAGSAVFTSTSSGGTRYELLPLLLHHGHNYLSLSNEFFLQTS